MKYFWAALLILVGVLFLAGNFNLLNNFQIEQIFRFWPIILILWGLYYLVRGERGGNAIMLVALVLSILFVSYFAFSRDGLNNSRSNRETAEDGRVREYIFGAVLEEGVTKGKINVNTGAVKFNINGTTSKLLEGTAVSNFMEARVKTTLNGDEVTATLESTAYRRMMYLFRNFKNELNLKLNKDLPINLEVNTGASELNFDLSQINLTGFLLKAGASNLDLTLGEKVRDGANVEIQAGASNIDIEVPKEIGVKINTESGLVSENFKGFVKKDGFWESEGYENSSTKINLVLRSGASSITVNRY